MTDICSADFYSLILTKTCMTGCGGTANAKPNRNGSEAARVGVTCAGSVREFGERAEF